MAEIKTLANCSLREFLAQTNKIRKDAAEFLELTKISKIRQHVPAFTGEETEEEKEKMFKEQGRKNLNDIAVAAELFGNKKIMDFFGTLLGLVQ